MASSIAATLRGCPGIDMVQLEEGPSGSMSDLGCLGAHTVVVDLSVAKPELLSALLRTCPNLLLIGADPASEELLVLSSRPVRVLGRDGLLQLIEKNNSSEKF